MKFNFLLLFVLVNALAANIHAANKRATDSYVVESEKQEVFVKDSLPTISAPTQNQMLSVCVGQSVDLEFDGAPLSSTTFLEVNWYHNDLFVGMGEQLTLANVMQEDAGNYTAEITRYNNCASITESFVMYTVMLNSSGPQVVTGVTEEVNYVCAGNNFSYALETNVPVDSYNWTHNGNTVSTDAVVDIFNFSPDYEGDYFCTVAATNECGTTDTTFLMFTLLLADLLPLVDMPTVQNTTVCLGNEFVLDFGSFSNVSNYQWYFNDALVGEGQTIAIANTTDENEGIYYCEITGSNGCATLTEMYAMYNVQVSSGPFIITPEVLGTVDLCVGANIALVYYPADGGENFEWTYNDAVIGTGTLLDLTNVQYDQSGSYFCTATATDNCGTSSLTYEIATLNVVEVIMPVIIQVDGELQLQQVFNSYQWYLDGIPVSSGATLELSESGTYYVEVTNELGCGSVSDEYYFDGINYLPSGNIRIYPNPFENELNIQSSKPIEFVTIYNGIGAIVYKAAGPQQQAIDLSALSTGVYYVMLTHTGQQIEVLKVIKEN
jgi:Secretion system C-terminal sorting domain